MLALALVPVSGAAVSESATNGNEVWREDFSTDPASRGWRVRGDANHFRWEADTGRLAVTWDSRGPNAFLYLPLPTILTRADSFRFRCSLVLDDIATETPDTTFQLAFGLIRQTDAFSPSSFRGAGIHPAWGPRNLVEFDYFPASSSIASSFSAVAVATNNTRWATLDLFPYRLETGVRYEIEVAHEAADSRIHLRVKRDGLPFVEGWVVIAPNFGDFRLDAFSWTSYSGEHQPAGYGGQILAHGYVDDLELEFTPAPRAILEPSGPGGPLRISLPSISGWVPVLERRVGDYPWEPVRADPETGSDRWSFSDPDPPPTAAFYRVRLERP
ncbi:MAG: hypothetical protein AB7O66_07815 [Limisphaerales bacterium]